MLRFCALASGSKGNAAYVGTGDRGVLIDAGLPGRPLERRLLEAGLAPESVAAVVVTHEHRDHIRGVGVWCRRYGVPAYMTEACRRTADAVLGTPGLAQVEVREFVSGTAFRVDGLEFLPMATSHDAVDSVGFRIEDGLSSLGFATDLGHASPLTRATLARTHLLYLEANHDEDLLWNGPYPWFLKQRIRSRHGHLSNAQCAGLLGDLLHDRLQGVILGHLSETNNQPRLAYDTLRAVLAQRGAAQDVTLLVARQDRPGRVVEVRG